MNGQAAAYSSRCRIRKRNGITVKNYLQTKKRLKFVILNKRSLRSEGSLFEKFRIVLAEHFSHRRRRPFRHSMNRLDQTIDVRSHHQQIPAHSGPRIPIRMRRPTRHEHSRTGARFDYVRPGPDAQVPLQHVPDFVVAVMKMQRSNPARRPRRTTRILPLGNDKRIADGTENIPREWRRDTWRTHRATSPLPAPTSPAKSRTHSPPPADLLLP